MTKIDRIITKFQFKNAIIFKILFCFFSTNINFAFADIINTQYLMQVDSSEVVNIDSTDSGFDLIAIAGAGMTTSFNTELIRIKNGPIIALGIELPFTKSNIFSFELYAHSWIAKSLTLQDHYNYLDYSFRKINDNYYSQLGISASIKCYLFSIGKRFRFSTHLGWIFYSPKPSYRALDFGCGFYYKITDSYTISLNRRLTYEPGEFLTNDALAPNSILLMINYKFNVKL
jgi:hypothetical protein